MCLPQMVEALENEDVDNLFEFVHLKSLFVSSMNSLNLICVADSPPPPQASAWVVWYLASIVKIYLQFSQSVLQQIFISTLYLGQRNFIFDMRGNAEGYLIEGCFSSCEICIYVQNFVQEVIIISFMDITIKGEVCLCECTLYVHICII